MPWVPVFKKAPNGCCLLVFMPCVMVGMWDGEWRYSTSGISFQKIMRPLSCSYSPPHRHSWEKPQREQSSGEALVELTDPANSLWMCWQAVPPAQVKAGLQPHETPKYNHLVRQLSRIPTSRNWEIIEACGFKLLRFGVICQAVIQMLKQ